MGPPVVEWSKDVCDVIWYLFVLLKQVAYIRWTWIFPRKREEKCKKEKTQPSLKCS